MNTSYDQKNYEPYKLPGRNETPGNFGAFNGAKPVFPAANLQRFVQIELGSEKPALNAAEPQPIDAVSDEKRRVFSQMRQIARESNLRAQSPASYRDTYIKPSFMNDMSRVFYRQAVFMKDFEDDYTGFASFSAYFPYYGLMNNEQLRTYFTWRTKVRRGEITNTSLSYAYVYIYELLNIIGQATPISSLSKLMEFRKAFLPYNESIDKYLLKWIKDFHIYYDIPPFADFIAKNNLSSFFPAEALCGKAGFFGKFCGISKYDIKKSAFCEKEKHEEIEEAFNFVINRINTLTLEKGFSLNELIYEPGKEGWQPFRNALFYQKKIDRDKTVEISEKEIYICRQNKWFTVRVCTDGRLLVKYIMKQTESALRSLAKFKHKLTADINTAGELIKMLKLSGIYLEDEINRALAEFYAIKNRKVITVDTNRLDIIRLEAFETQEKLTTENAQAKLPVAKLPDVSQGGAIAEAELPDVSQDSAIAEAKGDEFHAAVAGVQPVLFKPDTQDDKWEIFKELLTETELNALSEVQNGGSISKFAHTQNIMPEILTDGINQKAYDTLGDIILDTGDMGEAVIYEDYAQILAKLL
ncbi:MAG: TerB N-terminal domain-containing protein [Clostridiales bacterium]|jgi:hypothetical protein|nr:TerB N-terminal domain-containing protein [Clostridiales bacterium]